MMKSKTFFTIVMIALALSACAKKDSDFAARYAKNKMGADVVNGAKTQEAAENAAAQGVEADIINIQKTSNGNASVVTATLIVNNYQVDVTTTHNNFQVTRGSTTVNGLTVFYSAVCGNANCNPYYASAEVYKNNTMVIQQGIRKYFDGITGMDRYQWLKPAESISLIKGASFEANDLYDTSVMVGLLNSATTANGGSSNGGLIK